MRVSYRGREDGWILSANKKGPTLDPVQDLASAAAVFDAQEASFAAAAAAASVAAEQAGEDRPLNAGGRKDSSWVPPSEFPPGHEESPVEGGGTAAGTRCLADADEIERSSKHGGNSNGELASSNGTGHTEYLKALGCVDRWRSLKLNPPPPLTNERSNPLPPPTMERSEKYIPSKFN